MTHDSGILLSPEDYDLYNKRIGLSLGYGITSHPLVGPKTFASIGKKPKDFVHRIVMHRKIQALLPPRNVAIVDHINGDILDCRRENLQLLAYGQNKRKSKRVQSSTGYTRIYHEVTQGKYRAVIDLDKKTHRFGTYKTAEEAAFMADVWAYRILPAGTVLNFPERIEEIRAEALKIDNPNWAWQREH